MAKKKIRKNRWSRREYLKWASNRNGSLKDAHPQVRRQLQKDKYGDEERWPSGKASLC